MASAANVTATEVKATGRIVVLAKIQICHQKGHKCRRFASDERVTAAFSCGTG
jgi:hypothetical protein